MAVRLNCRALARGEPLPALDPERAADTRLNTTLFMDGNTALFFDGGGMTHIVVLSPKERHILIATLKRQQQILAREAVRRRGRP